VDRLVDHLKNRDLGGLLNKRSSHSNFTGIEGTPMKGGFELNLYIK